MPEHEPLSAEPPIEDVKEAVGKLDNGKAVGTDNPCGEPLAQSHRNYAIPGYVYNIVRTVWRREDSFMNVLFKREDPHEYGY